MVPSQFSSLRGDQDIRTTPSLLASGATIRNRQYNPLTSMRFSFTENIVGEPAKSATQKRTMGFDAILMEISPQINSAYTNTTVFSRVASNYKLYGNIRRRNPILYQFVDVAFFKALHRRYLNGPIVVTPLVKQWNTENVANDPNIENPNREDGIAGSRPCVVYSIQTSLHYDDFNKPRVD
ncbi:uncharacterized protein EAF02_004453 [Botrytis sinoallii]|uniref:uncharacterized protein n=1 Tax=Botrytis sinoallii TaxID=1463999 RepID=UPI0019025EB3|nr:uncharacterized protein EAF02_004453 [Botrytis sinoallii]KAF7885944.1 hypothetical protein EAF02_004453 [Botrytis sinoallii]